MFHDIGNKLLNHKNIPPCGAWENKKIHYNQAQYKMWKTFFPLSFSLLFLNFLSNPMVKEAKKCRSEVKLNKKLVFHLVPDKTLEGKLFKPIDFSLFETPLLGLNLCKLAFPLKNNLWEKKRVKLISYFLGFSVIFLSKQRKEEAKNVESNLNKFKN